MNWKEWLVLIILVAAFIFVFNFKIVIGIGDSMKPTYNSHTPMLCKRQKEYEVGDVVYYVLDGYPITHRIINIDTYDLGDGDVIKRYTMKGDNNEYADIFPVFKENIVCKVV